jgi:uncharacterized protein DUF3429
VTPDRSETLPQAALLLGVAGALPFVLLSLELTMGWPLSRVVGVNAGQALLVWGAFVLMFLAGLQWGLAVATADRSDAWRRYGFAAFPSLAACLSLWIGGRTAFYIEAGAYALVAIYEVWSAGLGEMPRWHVRLRLALSVVVVSALGAAAHYGPP